MQTGRFKYKESLYRKRSPGFATLLSLRDISPDKGFFFHKGGFFVFNNVIVT